MEVGMTWVSTALLAEYLVCILCIFYFLLFTPLSVTGTKVFVMPDGMMKSNANLVDLIEKVKPEIRTLIEKCNTVSKSSKVFHLSKLFWPFGIPSKEP